MREEDQARRELERAREKAEAEERRYATALKQAQEELSRASGAKQAELKAQIEELRKRFAQAEADKERAISRAQLTRSGHAYIVSSVGSFA